MRISAWVMCLLLLLSSVVDAGDWPTFRNNNQRTGVTDEKLTVPLHLQWEFSSSAPPAKGWSLTAGGYGFIQKKPNICYDDAYRVVSVGDTAYFSDSADNCVYAIDAVKGRVKWRFFTEAAPRHAPVIWQGKICFGADDGKVYCLDAGSGSSVWQFNAAPRAEQMLGYGRFSSLWPVRGGVMIDDGVLYFTAGLFPAEEIYLFALDPKDGRMIYRRRIDSGRFSGPAPQGYILTMGESMFFPARATTLRYDMKTGRKIKTAFAGPQIKGGHNWKGVLSGSNARIIDTMFVVGNGCLGFFDPKAERFDKYKRKVIGNLLFDIPHAFEVIVKDETVYLLTLTHLAAFPKKDLADIANKEYRAFMKGFSDSNLATKISAEETYNRIVKERGAEDVFAKHLKQTTFKWNAKHWDKWKTIGPKVTGDIRKRSKWFLKTDATECMIMAGKTLFVGGESNVYAVDAGKGTILWTKKTNSRVRGLTVANGRLFVSTIDGKVRCYAPTAPAKIAELPSLTTPVKGKAAELAKLVLAESDWRRGYVLLVGATDTGLAAELAKQTKLSIVVLAKDPKQVDSMREGLARAGLYGTRVTVNPPPGKQLPYPPHVFNIVVDEAALRGQSSGITTAELPRVTRPLGGIILAKRITKTDMRGVNVRITKAGGISKGILGRLPGSEDWTHNYATSANTYCSEDKLVKAPFGILWYGEPGPKDRIERHASPPIPLVINGTILTLGYDRVLAYDAYNGIEYWRRNILGVTKMHMGKDSSNMVAEGNSLFVIVSNRECLELDIKTGKTVRKISPPKKEGVKYSFWSWLAADKNTIYGSRPEIDERRRRPKDKTSASVFALDRKTGQLKWSHDGAGIEHSGICLAGGKVFFVDAALSEAEKKQALADTIGGTTPITELKDARGKAFKPSLGKLVAINAADGKTAWQRPLNLTDLTIDERMIGYKPDLFSTVVCMYKDEHLVLANSGGFGHPWKSYVAGKFSRRPIYVFNASSGKLLWWKRLGYRRRPIVIGEWIYAEPSAWNLKTGKQKMIKNPLSGQEQKLDMHRGYIGCGHLLASGAAIFGNASGGIGVWNIGSREGYTPFGDMSLSCGLDLTPANGVLVAPEGRSGCNCGTPIHTSIVLYPTKRQRAWGGGAYGSTYKDANSLPVKHLSVNLGAPGMREDNKGNFWMPYMFVSGKTFPTNLVPKWYPNYAHDRSMFYDEGVRLAQVSNTDIPWVYSSGYRNRKVLWFLLQKKGAAPASYTVRLHFAEPAALKAGERVFNVKLQGKEILSSFDIFKEAGGASKALVKEFKGIAIKDRISIEMTPNNESKLKEPILCGLQVFRESD